MSPAITVRCRVRGCSCLLLTKRELQAMMDAPPCQPCGGSGEIRQRGYPTAICGVCHGWGRQPARPRWISAQESEREWQEAIDAPLGG